MLERRQAFRGRVYYGGRVAFNDRKSTIDCIVRNFSPWGAKIHFENSGLLPDEIDIIIERKGAAYLASVIWRRENEAGLAFRKPRHSNADAVPLDRALRRRATERANKALRTRIDELRTGY